MADLRNRLIGNSLYLFSQLTRKTGRYQVSGIQYLEEAKSTGRPIIFVAWHGMTMMLVGFFSDHYDLSSIMLLLPDDWRGEALAVFSSKLDAKPFPVDLTGERSMATARKLVELVRFVRNGEDCYITPDGPEGPAYVIKPGVAYIAKKTNALILPLGAYSRHAYRVNRWDQYVMPYPFSRISIEVGSPITIDKDISDMTTVTESLTDDLHRVTAQAAANYYEKKP